MTTMTTAITRQEASRERIIAAAMRLWQQAHNVNKVSLAEIAREAGVSETTLYNTFGTREKLVEEVIEHLLEGVLEKQRAILKGNSLFPAKIQSMISIKMKATEGVRVDLLDKICTDPVARKYVDDTYEAEVKPMMTSVLEQGRREGYIRPDLPDEVILLYFDILKSGNAACTEELRKIVSDKRLTVALTRLIYFGLFQKEFALPFDGAAGGKSK